MAYVDSRPNWDDAGVTAGAIFIACAALGAALPRLAWLWALAVGGWIPLRGIALRHDFAMLVILVFAFAGAYAGVALRKGVDLARHPAA
jgi:uncharacterized RDD family membrane protein YckC